MTKYPNRYLVAGVPPEHLGADVAAFMGEVSDYCTKAGISSVTLGIYVNNYAETIEQIAAKSEEVYVAMTKVRAYMKRYPPGEQVNLQRKRFNITTSKRRKKG